MGPKHARKVCDHYPTSNPNHVCSNCSLPKPQCRCPYPDIDLSGMSHHFCKSHGNSSGHHGCPDKGSYHPRNGVAPGSAVGPSVGPLGPRHRKCHPCPPSEPLYRPVPSSCPIHGPGGNMGWTKRQYQMAALHQALVFDIPTNENLL
jgi:hypothetical protein